MVGVRQLEGEAGAGVTQTASTGRTAESTNRMCSLNVCREITLKLLFVKHRLNVVLCRKLSSVSFPCNTARI